ncbi:hypothetical protein BJX99DRAFT_258724 [Aspergillus californicus]
MSSYLPSSFSALSRKAASSKPSSKKTWSNSNKAASRQGSRARKEAFARTQRAFNNSEATWNAEQMMTASGQMQRDVMANHTFSARQRHTQDTSFTSNATSEMSAFTNFPDYTNEGYVDDFHGPASMISNSTTAAPQVQDFATWTKAMKEKAKPAPAAKTATPALVPVNTEPEDLLTFQTVSNPHHFEQFPDWGYFPANANTVTPLAASDTQVLIELQNHIERQDMEIETHKAKISALQEALDSQAKIIKHQEKKLKYRTKKLELLIEQISILGEDEGDDEEFLIVEQGSKKEVKCAYVEALDESTVEIAPLSSDSFKVPA